MVVLHKDRSTLKAKWVRRHLVKAAIYLKIEGSVGGQQGLLVLRGEVLKGVQGVRKLPEPAPTLKKFFFWFQWVLD